MNASTPTIKSVEKYLEELIRISEEGGGANVPENKILGREEYHDVLEKIDCWYFVLSADYHYFISRTLYLHYVTLYSQFCGYQCIENYLKAFLKFMDQIPPNSHDLRHLLSLCCEHDSNPDSFFKGAKILIIISKYEPFYEIARYPVQHQHPKGGYAFIIPNDIYILDYFVLKMREIITLPSNVQDIFKTGQTELLLCQQNAPSFYNTFQFNNINYLHN